MVKVTVFNGSPKGKSGNTAKLVENFLKGFEKEAKNCSIERVEIKDKNIKNCTGCFSCWDETPGKCIFEDDMKNLIQKYADTDLVIWATPLYHYGMTSILKTFIERTLPVNKPEMIKTEDGYGHPQRYDLSDKDFILISTCGFPHHEEFEILKNQFEEISFNGLDGMILSVMGELLSIDIMRGEIDWYLEAVEKAGKEYAKNGEISEDIRNTLSKKLIDEDTYVELANDSWN